MPGQGPRMPALSDAVALSVSHMRAAFERAGAGRLRAIAHPRLRRVGGLEDEVVGQRAIDGGGRVDGRVRQVAQLARRDVRADPRGLGLIDLVLAAAMVGGERGERGQRGAEHDEEEDADEHHLDEREAALAGAQPAHGEITPFDGLDSLLRSSTALTQYLWAVVLPGWGRSRSCWRRRSRRSGRRGRAAVAVDAVEADRPLAEPRDRGRGPGQRRQAVDDRRRR